jgi:hypothetical protein
MDLPRRVDPPKRSEERESSPRNLFDRSDHPDANSLRRCPSRARSTGSASTPSMPHEAYSSTAPRCVQSLIIRGSRAPDVQVSLPAGGGQGSTFAAAEVRRIAPEHLGEYSTTIVLAGRSGAAPESAKHQGPAPELAGAKRSAPEQGPLDRPAKRTQARSKMEVLIPKSLSRVFRLVRFSTSILSSLQPRRHRHSQPRPMKRVALRSRVRLLNPVPSPHTPRR